MQLNKLVMPEETLACPRRKSETGQASLKRDVVDAKKDREKQPGDRHSDAWIPRLPCQAVVTCITNGYHTLHNVQCMQ